MKKYLVIVLLILILGVIFFVAQKNATRHQIANSSKTIANPTTSEISLSYKISQAPGNQVAIQGYDVFLVSNDETVKMVAEGDEGAGLDAGHPDYDGDYELVSAKTDKGVSDFALDDLIEQPPVTAVYFTDDQPHNGIQKFIDPITGQEFIKLYQYGSGSSEVLYMFRVDDNGQIIPVNFYDEGGNANVYLDTDADSAIDSFFDNTKASIGVCNYDNANVKTYCDEYENKNNNFYLIKSKVFNGMTPLLK